MKRAAMPSILVVVVLLAVAVIAEAQQPKKVFRIGYLTSSEPVGDSARAEAFRQILRGLGYIEGQNIITEYRYAAGKPDRLSGLAAELVSLKVDVIVVAGGSGPIRAAKNATKTIPIVMMGPGLDPVEAGFVESLAHPGGNITGFTDLSGHLGGKRLELLKDVVPKVARVAVLYEANNPRNTFEFKEVLPVSARALGLTMQPQEVRDENDLTRVFAVINKDRPDGLLVLGGPIMNLNYKRTANFVLKSRLPSVYDRREAVDAGGLIFYGADLADSYRRIAYYVDRILKGAKPADLPVEQPTKFEFVINLKTAKQIGVTIPPEVLARANRLIK
jgi:putative tryptophan/tyrosine transport system substrate-binding protein